MSCPVCEGHPGCPCCATEPRMITCPDCNGTGYTYYNENGDEITEHEYDNLPAKSRDKDTCDQCEGVGEIEYEYEPDYDYYDE